MGGRSVERLGSLLSRWVGDWLVVIVSGGWWLVWALPVTCGHALGSLLSYLCELGLSGLVPLLPRELLAPGQGIFDLGLEEVEGCVELPLSGPQVAACLAILPKTPIILTFVIKLVVKD